MSGSLDLAREGFQDYIRNYPNTPRAPDAQMGLGDSWYDAGDFEQAILEYDLLLQRYPNSGRIADAFLKKAQAHLNLGQNGQARAAFQRLVDEFPDQPQGLRAEAELETLGN